MDYKERIFTWIVQHWFPEFFRPGRVPRFFDLSQRLGYHILPVQYYSPIPDTREISEKVWESQTEMVGLDTRDADQLNFLSNVIPLYLTEFDQFPREPSNDPIVYFHENFTFVGADAVALYCMVRHNRPGHVIEVGSGMSTRITAAALARNGCGELICIEPYPNETLKAHPGISSLLIQKVQEVDISLFEVLEDGDILFIDTTHAIKTGGDVPYLFLEVLPRLKPGVRVQIHDIFLPRDYPRPWVLDFLMFSSEQYLVQAFLAFNSGYEFLFSSSYMTIRHRDAMEAQIGRYPRWDHGCSLWIKRV